MGCGSSTAKPEQTHHGKTLLGEDKDKHKAKEENKEYAQIMNFLDTVRLFKRLPKDHHPQLAAAFVPTQFDAQQVIIRQGDQGDAFFVIRSGDAIVNVETDGVTKQVAKLTTGDYFGEAALLRDDPRNATIIAETPLSSLKITRDKFQSLNLHEKLTFPIRKAVGAGGGRQVEIKPPSPKTPEEVRLIAEALRGNAHLTAMVSLNDSRIQQLVDVAWREVVEEGHEIIREGDLQADYFYVVANGTFEVHVLENDDTAVASDDTIQRSKSKHVNTITKGGSFGELALLYYAPRAATVVAKGPSTVWVIDRTNFKNILLKASMEKIEEYVGYLDKVELLSPLLKEERKAVAEVLTEYAYVKGDKILEQGVFGNTFYILREGEVVVTHNGVEKAKLCASSRDAPFFGERALLQNEARNATVTVISKTAKVLGLDRDSFNCLLGPLQEILAVKGEERASALRSNQKGMPVALPDESRQRIMRKELQKIGLLGCGGFGVVELVEQKSTGNTFALKTLSKGYIVKTCMQESVMTEKKILLMTNSPFITKLYECYNGKQSLYFLMEVALGGELYALYNRKGFSGSEDHAKYYAAGVVFAFEHLHERHIIYRDLKPENLLLNELGHVKLTDMGLAKFVIGTTYTTCGTPDYFAPELIASMGHTKAVDWWTLGILVFEFMSGHTPFESEYPMQIYGNVMKGIDKVNFPPKTRGAVGDLVKGLLKKEPGSRLPMRQGGVENIKHHKWYQSFGWQIMFEGSLEAPYKPVVKTKTDIQNFWARKEDMPRALEYKDDGSGWDADFAT